MQFMQFLKCHLVFLMDVPVITEAPALLINSRGNFCLRGWDQPALKRQCHCGNRGLNNGRLLFMFCFLFFFWARVLDGARLTVAAESPAAPPTQQGSPVNLQLFTTYAHPGAQPRRRPSASSHLIFTVSSCPLRSSLPGTLLRRCLSPPHPSLLLSPFSHCHA